MSHILIVDDQIDILMFLESALGDDHEISTANSGEKCLAMLDEDEYDCVLLDLIMPGIGGMNTLREVVSRHNHVPVVMLTGGGDIPTAVESMKIGAFDYLTKPPDMDELRLTLKRAVEKTAMERELQRLKAEIGKIYGITNIVGKHPLMQSVYKRVEMVAPRKSSVLIVGESGTGKELVARAIHQLGPLRDGPFVPVNCAAIPDNLLEDEFFGHEKGAFTDAMTSRAGCFEQANHGTLLLDEISELSPNSQAKLLRVLQERELKRIGGTKSIKVDVRLIASTNKDLSEMVEKGEFRQDLFYRVHVVPLKLPALRERSSDIPLLLGHFLKKIAKREEIEPKEISQDAMDRLMRHEWPGNVRELENLAEQLMALVPGPIVYTKHLPASIMQDEVNLWFFQDLVLSGSISLPEAVEKFEFDTIAQALELHEGNKSQVAKALGITRRILNYKMNAMQEAGETLIEGEDHEQPA